MSKECSKFISRAKSLNPFQTKSGSFYINRPRKTDEGKTNYEEVPLDSASTRMYLKAIFAELTGRGLVTEAEFRTIIEMIKGIAIEQPLRMLSDCGAETIEHKPVLMTLLQMARKGPFTDTPVNLLAKVNTELRLNGVKVEDPSFPTTEDAFGRQLSLLKEDAAKMGLILRRNETGRPRTWTGYLAKDAPPSSVGSDGNVTDGSPDHAGTSGGSDTTTASDTHQRAPLALTFSAPVQIPSPRMNGQRVEVVNGETEGDRS